MTISRMTLFLSSTAAWAWIPVSRPRPSAQVSPESLAVRLEFRLFAAPRSPSHPFLCTGAVDHGRVSVRPFPSPRSSVAKHPVEFSERLPEDSLVHGHLAVLQDGFASGTVSSMSKPRNRMKEILSEIMNPVRSSGRSWKLCSTGILNISMRPRNLRPAEPGRIFPGRSPR